MALNLMVSLDRIFEPNVVVLPNYSNGSDIRYIRHHWDCTHKGCEFDTEKHADCHSGCYRQSPIAMLESFAGCVLATWERNGYDDSDFFASVWNEEKQCIEVIEYGTTRAWTYPNTAVVDATPEVKAKANAYTKRCDLQAAILHDISRAAEVAKGKACLVVKGRKIAKGSTVKVISVRPPNQWHTVEALVDTGKALVATNIENLQVINPASYLTPESELAASIARKGDRY
jgi:hypothetical protein